VSKWIELNQDNLRIGTAKAVARLMSFAQITCSVKVICCVSLLCVYVHALPGKAISEMTYTVSAGMFNPTYLLTFYVSVCYEYSL